MGHKFLVAEFGKKVELQGFVFYQIMGEVIINLTERIVSLEASVQVKPVQSGVLLSCCLASSNISFGWCPHSRRICERWQSMQRPGMRAQPD